MIGDDLTGLLRPADAPQFGFRQGVVLAFDLFSGANQITVAGTVLSDVPFLNDAGFTPLAAGDVVVLIRMRSSWAILGRIVVPGAHKAIGRFTEVTGAAAGATAAGYALTTTYLTRATLAVPVPVWAEVVTVTATLMSQARNSTGATDHLQGKIVFPDGQAINWTAPSTAPGLLASHTVVAHHQMFVTPGGVLNLEGQVRSITAGWAASADNGSFLQATLTWNSNDG